LKQKKRATPKRRPFLFVEITLPCRKLLINTRLQPGAKGTSGENRLNGFSLARPWFTALKRGANEMIPTG